LDAFTMQGLAFGFRLLLAQQLGPADFGILSMAATTLLVLGALNDFGLSATLIQRKKSEMSEAFIATAFTGAVFISAGLFLCNQFLVAPLSASFFRTPEVSSIVMVLGCAFLFFPITTVSNALLMRARNFEAMTKCRVIAQLLSMALGAFVLIVYRTLWAAPIQVLSAQFFTTVLMFVAQPWRPRLCWDSGLRRELFGFSSVVFMNNLLVTLSKNAGQIVLGRTLGPADLGIYALAFSLTDTLRTAVMSVMNRVMFVHYAENQENALKLAGDYLRTLAWNCSIVFPLMLMLVINGPDLMVLLLGEKWGGMEVVLPILAVAVMVHVAGGSTSSLLTAIGKPGLDLRLFALTTIGVMFPAIIVGGLYFGAAGVAAGLLLAKVASVIIRQFYMKALIGLEWGAYGRLLGLQSLLLIPLGVALALVNVYALPMGIWLYTSSIAFCLLPYGAVFLWSFVKK
jgi:teichuronic acid exporter